MAEAEAKCSLGTVAAIAILFALAPVQVCGRPNIVLITVDTFRPDHLGCYGYERDTSPQLDSFGREGVIFTRAFTTSGWTTPGLISIHTSLYAPSHAVDIRGKSIDPEVVTLAEALAEAGYRVPDIFFLTDIPNFHHLGLETYPRRTQYLKEGDEILFRWLEEEANHSERPFFLYYHYRDLHQPYAPGAEYDALFTPAAFGHSYNPLSHVRRFIASEKRDLVQREIYLPRGILDFAPRDRPWVEALYDGQIRRMDDRLFARLRRTLEATGLAENTLVVVSADHGEELLDHGLIGHVSTYKEPRLYDEVIRIPLIMWYPAGLPARRSIAAPVQCIDIMPTLLEMADTRVPPGAQGRSLLPLIAGEAAYGDARPIFCETSGGGYGANDEQYVRRLRAVRTERWKLLHDSRNQKISLYDLANDPTEDDDIADDHRDIADSLHAVLNAWVLASQPRRTTPATTTVSTARVRGAGEVPQILFPLDGDTLRYVGEDQTIQLAWTGDPMLSYTIEYSVGEGTYHLEGELTESTNRPSYGPFHAGFWNSLTLYNPWTFRVYPADRPQEKSRWVTFHLAVHTAGGEPSSGPLLFAAVRSLQEGVTQMALLSSGLALGLVDLYLWVALVPPADLSAWILLATIVVAALWPRVRRLDPERSRAWGFALANIALVYSAVPVVPEIWGRLREHTQGAIRHLGIVVVIAVAVFLVARLWRRTRLTSWTPYLAMAVIFGAYGYLLFAFSRHPAERLHLFEYGLVSVLLFRALRLHISSTGAYVSSLCLTALVGIVDETIQWVLPQRFFELKDVELNVISGALGLLLVRFGFDVGGDGIRRAPNPVDVARLGGSSRSVETSEISR